MRNNINSKTISSIACPKSEKIQTSWQGKDLKREMRKMALKPNTSAYETRKKMQIERAKFNYAAIKICLSDALRVTERGDYVGSPEAVKENRNKSALFRCLSSYVSYYQFWECKYYGYKDFPCFKNMTVGEDFRENYHKVREYIRENQTEFDSIDFSNWVFYDRMEF